MSRCNAKDCRRETPLAIWAEKAGLVEHHTESVKEHAQRCVAFILSKNKGLGKALQGYIAAAPTDLPVGHKEWLENVE